MVLRQPQYLPEVRHAATVRGLDWLESRLPELTPICHCGCCRKCTEHNEMKAAA
jgi:hypothetical protein